MRKSIAAAVIAASAATSACGHDRSEDGGPTVVAQLPGRRTSSRSRSPGPYDVEVRTGAQPERLRARAARSCSSSTVVEVKGDKLRHPSRAAERLVPHAAGPPRQGAVRRHRPAAARRDDRRLGRHQASTRSRAISFEGTVAGSGGLSVGVDRRADAQAVDRRARAASRPAPARRRAPNMTSPVRATSTPAAIQAQTRRRSRSPARAASRAHATGTADVSIMGSGDVDVTGGAKCNVSKAGLGQRPLLLKRRLNHDRRKVGACAPSSSPSPRRAARRARPARRPAISAITGFDRRSGSKGRSRSRSTTGVAPFARASGSAAALDRVAIEVRGDTLVVHINRVVVGRLSRRQMPGRSRSSIGTHDLSSALAQRLGRAAIDRVKGLTFDLVGPGLGPAPIGAGRRRSAEHHASSEPPARRSPARAAKLTALVRGISSLDAAGLAAKDATIGAEGAATIERQRHQCGDRSTASGPATITLDRQPACTLQVERLGQRQRLQTTQLNRGAGLHARQEIPQARRPALRRRRRLRPARLRAGGRAARGTPRYARRRRFRGRGRSAASPRP